MTYRFVAPTLIALAFAGSAAAQDGIAPVITFPVNALQSSSIDAVEGSSGQIFFLDDVKFTAGMYRFDGSSLTPFTADASNGIVITGVSGPGIWSYSEDGGSNWSQMDPAAEDNFITLPLLVAGIATQVRFVPNSANGTNQNATLTFRALDLIDGSTPTSTYNSDPFSAATFGGSPTPFSAETRSFIVPIVDSNDAPQWNNIYTDIPNDGSASVFTTPFPASGGVGRAFELSVSTLVDAASPYDPDTQSSSVQGILLMDLDSLSGMTLSRYDGEVWVSINPGSLNAIFLNYSDRLLITPTDLTYSPAFLNSFNYRLWDGSSGDVAGDLIDASGLSTGGTTAFSSSRGAVEVDLVANQSPTILFAPSAVVFNPGQGSVDATVTAEDSDGSVVDFGLDLGEGGFATGMQTLQSEADLSWSVTPGSPGYGTMTISNLPSKTGEIETFWVAAQDDVGDVGYSSEQEIMLYGNSAPLWDADAITTATVGLTVDNQEGSLLSTTFAIHDVDVDTPSVWWADTLSFGGEAGSSMRVYTDKGYADLTVIAPEIILPPPVEGAAARAVNGLPNLNGWSVQMDYTPNARAEGDDSFIIRVYDANGLYADLPVTVAITSSNHAPVIVAPVPETNLGTVLGGTSVAVTAQATDVDGDVLSWSVLTEPMLGTLTQGQRSGGNTTFTYTADVSGNGVDTFTLSVADGTGGTAQVTVTATVTPNTPPALASTIGTGTDQSGRITALAVAGQSFEALITGRDSETPQGVQVTISGTTPAGVAFTTSGSGLGSLAGTPTTPGTYEFTITIDDGVNRTTRTIEMTVVAPVLANVPPPAIPVSVPGRVAYGAFLPGSAANFQAIVAALAGRPNTEARAFWWDSDAGRYAELPVLPTAASQPWHALWLASTAPVTLPAEIPAVALPYAIDLAPGWTFFGLPPMTDGTAVATAHPWANCSVQSASGVTLTADERAAVLGNADAAGPWAWDGDVYARTTTMATGSGYWLYNRGSQPVRLVRGATAAVVPASVRTVAVRVADDVPPAPPGGAKLASSDGGGGSCGAGSGLGLLTIAGLLSFARFRRR